MIKEIPVTLKPEWRKSPSTQYYMQILYLGSVAVCKYRKFFPSGDTVSFVATCAMPSIETDLGVFKTEDDARLACIGATKLFIEQLQRTIE